MKLMRILSSARKVYRRVLAPFGHRKVQRMIDDGLPAVFQRPLEFLFDKELTHTEQEVARKVEMIRAGVTRLPQQFETVSRKDQKHVFDSKAIGAHISVDPEFGMFLYLCAQIFKARTILELGSCAGISGCYLASASQCEIFVTVEGSQTLAALARTNLTQVAKFATVVNASFDDALDQILPDFGNLIDLVYIDGHHDYLATLHYFDRLRPCLNRGAVLVFDDIHLSAAMQRAWQQLTHHEGFAHTVDAGRLGVCLWDGSSRVPMKHDLHLYLGWLKDMSRFALRPTD
jgi:predicted O-methyltransferase YrrM